MREKLYELKFTEDEIRELELALQYHIDAVLLPKMKQIKATRSLEEQAPYYIRAEILSNVLKKIVPLVKEPNPSNKFTNMNYS